MSLQSKVNGIAALSDQNKMIDQLADLLQNESEDFTSLDAAAVDHEVSIDPGAVQGNLEFRLSPFMKVSNPSGTWHFVHDVQIISPLTLRGAVNAVRWAEQQQRRIRGIGAFHSFSTVDQVDHCYVNMKECTGYNSDTFSGDIDQSPMDLLKDASGKHRYVNIPAGLKIESINHVLQYGTHQVTGNRRLFNMGGGDVQAFAGAFSTGTHGSGGKYSAYHDMIRSLVLVASGGRVFRIEPANGITDPVKHAQYFQQHANEVPVSLIHDDDCFYSAVLSMGCFGIIWSVILEVAPFTLLHEEARYIKAGWTAELKDRVRGGMLPHDLNDEKFVYLQLNPYRRKGRKNVSVMLKETAPTHDPGSGKKDNRRKLWPQIFSNSKLSVGFIRRLANDGAFPPVGLIEAALKNQNDNKDKGGGFTDACYKVWNAGSGKLKPIGTAIEFAMPVEQVPDVVDAITGIMQHEAGSGRGFYLNSPMALRFVRPSNVYLAPNYFQHLGKTVTEWCYLEILRVNSLNPADDKRELELFEYLQTFLKIQKARPHWGLNFRFPFDESLLSEFYPKFTEWLKAFLMFNASGVFDNEFTRSSNLREAALRKFAAPLQPPVVV
jgi:hypothetical protein